MSDMIRDDILEFFCKNWEPATNNGWIRTRKNEAVSLPKSLSVEHLLPQKGQLWDYPYADGMPLEPDETNDKCRERLIHTVGNLTLLTQELNSAVSNGPFEAKAAQIVQ